MEKNMIYTVTLNPSLDYIVSVDDFTLGRVNRTKTEIIYPGGKGINVSMVLKNLGHDSHALGFVAGFTGQEIVRLLDEWGVQSDFIRVEEGISRINVKLRSNEESEINGQGPAIAKEHIKQLYQQLDHLKDGDVLVLAGSIPDVMPDDIYMDIMKHLSTKKIHIIVDATRDLLVNVLPYHPFLIKPNNHELGEIFGVELKEKGVYFAVATGRNYDAVYPMFGKAKDHIVYICNDGGSVIYRDKVISKTPLDRLVCLEVANELEKNRDYKLLFSGERNAVVTTRDIDFINYLRTMGIEPEKEKDTKSMKGEINKITIFAKKGFDQTSYEYFYKKFSKNANVAISNPEQLYLTAKYVTKGNAIQVLQHVFNSSEEDTVVFGGGYNDIEMFGHAYFSYAMQWADSEVRRSAKHIAENVNTILEDIIRM